MSDDRVLELEARRVYVYEVKLCREDGGKGSGWSVVVVMDTQDPARLLRTAQLAAAKRLNEDESRWTGLDTVELLHVGFLDPSIA